MTRTFEAVAAYHGGHHIVGYEEQMDHTNDTHTDLEVVSYLMGGEYFARDRGKPYNDHAAQLITAQAREIQNLLHKIRQLGEELERGRTVYKEAEPEIPPREEPQETNWRERLQDMGRVLPPE